MPNEGTAVAPVGNTARNIKAASAANTKKVIAIVDEDSTHLLVSIPKSAFLDLVGPTSTGKGSGAVVEIAGEFTEFAPDGTTPLETYTVTAGWRGCWLSCYVKS